VIGIELRKIDLLQAIKTSQPLHSGHPRVRRGRRAIEITQKLSHSIVIGNIILLFLCHNKNHVLCTLAGAPPISLSCFSATVLSNAPSSKQIAENWVLHWSKNNNKKNGCATLWPFHLSMKEGSLFYFVVMRSTEPGCLTSCSWCYGKLCIALAGVHGLWFHDVWTCGWKVLWILNDFLTEN